MGLAQDRIPGNFGLSDVCLPRCALLRDFGLCFSPFSVCLEFCVCVLYLVFWVALSCDLILLGECGVWFDEPLFGFDVLWLPCSG